jgi:hypothetical protein
MLSPRLCQHKHGEHEDVSYIGQPGTSKAVWTSRIKRITVATKANSAANEGCWQVNGSGGD